MPHRTPRLFHVPAPICRGAAGNRSQLLPTYVDDTREYDDGREGAEAQVVLQSSEAFLPAAADYV
eukprot:CAMPEP_0118638640 /NCGR_PEP_ID=MMETSP0785-20121206/3798_1 /TAXON_ID=91992 /ORGANISM="Bolidomonas pacifica, Strain CCMP 1866" /LENGTH=64 /DNA_ID=CAMNT_0006529915 /DNA_START=184 /DNA_END=378 /DNA_ORIENTATION=+